MDVKRVVAGARNRLAERFGKGRPVVEDEPVLGAEAIPSCRFGTLEQRSAIDVPEKKPPITVG